MASLRARYRAGRRRGRPEDVKTNRCKCRFIASAAERIIDTEIEIKIVLVLMKVIVKVIMIEIKIQREINT